MIGEELLTDIYHLSPAIFVALIALFGARQLINRLFGETIPRLAGTFEKRAERAEEVFREEMRLHRADMLRRDEMFLMALEKVNENLARELKAHRAESLQKMEQIREALR